MNNQENKFEHAWRYFQLHATQRITVFNYFLLISGVVASGLAATLQGSQRFSSLGVVLGLLLTLVSFVFWKLDQRTAFLIKHAELVLIEIEKEASDKKYQIFNLELELTSGERNNKNVWLRRWSYGKSFRLIFIIMSFFGLGGTLLSGAKFLGLIAW
jgi:hypothetical protein